MISGVESNAYCNHFDELQPFKNLIAIDQQKQTCFDFPSGSKIGFGDPQGTFVVQRDGRDFCLLGIPSFSIAKDGSSKNMGVFSLVGFYKEWILDQIYLQELIDYA